MKLTIPTLLISVVALLQSAQAADWPQWRHDAQRSGATDDSLSRSMKEQWSFELGQPAAAYTHQYRMCADVSYAPVAADGMLFMPSNVTDQVMAFDLESGQLIWRHVAEAPVRFAPIYNEGRVYFTSDDGHLYCVDAKDGQLIWKQRGVPAAMPDMLMLVNGRMSSRWPARGAPLLHDGLVYFGAGVWPEEGVYQNAVNAETGKLVWQNDVMSAVKDGMCDHGVNYDISLPPQGYPAVIHGALGVASGRTIPAWFDLKSGEMEPYTSFYVKFRVPRGNWYLAGNDQFWVQAGNIFAAHEHAAPPKPEAIKDIPSPLSYSMKASATAEYTMKHRPFLCADKANGEIEGEGSANVYSEPVVTEDTLYASVYEEAAKYSIPRGHSYVKNRTFDKITARDLTAPKWIVDKTLGKKASKDGYSIVEFPIKWEMQTSLKVLIKADDLLIAGESNQIAAISIPEAGGSPEVVWEAAVDGFPVNVLVADEKLVVVTDTGSVHCFGEGAAVKAGIPFVETSIQSPKNGFAGVLGWGDGTQALELAKNPDWRVIIFEKDAAKVKAARESLNKLGLCGRRAQVIQMREGLEVTPYWASQLIVNDPNLFGSAEQTLSFAVDVMRPFSGKMALSAAVDQQVLGQLIAGKIDFQVQGAELLRISAPEGAADWTHESGGADNSFVSQDKLVKWPLGILWYSGDVDRFFTPESHYQHDRNPYPLIKDGRMFIITIDELHAIDVYTGDYLWERKMPESPYFNTRLISNRIYGRPTERNFTLSQDLIYCISHDSIIAYDVQSGEEVSQFTAPEEMSASAKAAVAKVKEKSFYKVPVQSLPEWTEVRMLDDLLIARVGDYLIGVDRHSGKLQWSRKSTQEEMTYTIGDGIVYGLECPTESYQTKEAQTPRSGLLYALDPESGALLWERDLGYMSIPASKQGGIRTWMKPPIPFLGYNTKHQLLVVTYNGNNVIVSHAKDGSEFWSQKNPEMENDARVYSPNIMEDHLFMSLNGMFKSKGYILNILTGEKLQANYELPKSRGCGRLVGNEHLMSYRDASVEMYDIDSKVTIPFNSMRAGCTTSFVPANGVMAAPGLQHGCVCNYPMSASLAMVHMPGLDQSRPEIVKATWGADLKSSSSTKQKSQSKKKKK